MPTCEQLPQLGCCDDGEVIPGLGYYKIIITTPQLAEGAVSPAAIPGLFGRMRRWLAAQDLPPEGFHRIIEYNIATDSVVLIGDQIDPGPGHGDLFPIGWCSSRVRANYTPGLALPWVLAGSRQVIRIERDNPFLSAEFPVCVFRREEGVSSCIQPRLTTSTADAFGTDPITGVAGYRWRVLDLGDSLLFESNGGLEECTAQELTITPQGLAIAHDQVVAWFVDGGGAELANCCDMTPLPP